MEARFKKRTDKSLVILFFQVLTIDIFLEVVVYQIGGRKIFGKIWDGSKWNEEYFHIAWLTFISTPILFETFRRQFLKQKQLSDEVWKLAHYDELTGLLNRYIFKEQLEEVLKKSKTSKERLGVLFIDLDRFKNINDSFGHDVGDQVLKIVSERIQSTLRKKGVLARFGGDEFVAFLPNINQNQEVIKIMNNILLSIKEKIVVDSLEFHVTSSIGLAMFPNSGVSVSSLLKSADVAMYKAKKEGKNCYEIHMPSMQELAYAKFRVENDLRKILNDKESSGQLFVEYQPQVSIKNGNIIGSEALVRWKHPDIGLISPSEFIPIAEEIGLINKLSSFVLESVCSQIRKWQDEGVKPVPISVNISQLELSDTRFVKRILDIINSYNIQYSLVSIEITETALMKNRPEVTKKLQQLRDLGIRILLDDFGKGYNSLGILKGLPIDILKIDKEFVRYIHNSPMDESILTTLVQLAHLCKLQVVAEGVEINHQLEVLKEKDCDVYQGFLFSPPILPDKFNF